MTAPSLSPERSEELELLRRRAYGPGADITHDPAAQQRLRELEDLARHAGVAAEPAADAASAAGVAAEPPPTAPESARSDDSSDEPASEARPLAAATKRRAAWKRIPVWAVTAVLGIALGLGVGLTWPTDSGPSPDLTLGIDPDGGERGAGFAENLHYWGVDEGSLVPHESYDVIQVWTAFAVDGSRCLLLSHDGSFLSATCTGAGLDPVLDFTVYDGLSLDLDDSLPVGTVIRFLGHEGSVDVWVRPPGGQAPSASSSATSRPSWA
jgi:hypothetical protein